MRIRFLFVFPEALAGVTGVAGTSEDDTGATGVGAAGLIGVTFGVCVFGSLFRC